MIMIPELGHFALILASVVALVQGTVPMLGAARGNAAWMDFASAGGLAAASARARPGLCSR